MNRQYRNVCFTLNNYTEEEYSNLINIDCNYVVIGKEVGEERTPHLQGYIEFKTPKRFSTLKKINDRIHWEERRGTAKQASDYCKKEKCFEEKGEISQQGKRNDLHMACEILEHGGKMRDVALHDGPIFVKYHRGLRAYRDELQLHRTQAPIVYWYWGNTGCGKTYSATRHENYYLKDNSKWWDGYEYNEVVVIDDFRAETWEEKHDGLLRLLQEYKLSVQTKGGWVKFNTPVIYITSDRPPDEFWGGRDLEQVVRRIVEIKYFSATVATQVGGNTITPTLE